MPDTTSLNTISSAGLGDRTSSLHDVVASKAVLTEAIRQVDIIHTSFVGVAAIVITLLAAVALPVFGYQPVKEMTAFIVIIAASFVGVGYLYYVNYHVHQHVSNQARLTEVLVNSLGQGFLSFDRQGRCGEVYSQACTDLLEGVPAGKNVQQVLHISEKDYADFHDWMDILFMPNHALGFDDAIRFMPAFFPHSQGRRISLVYRPIRTKNSALFQVVVIATDQTEEYAAQQRAKQQQDFAEMVCRIFKGRNQFRQTLNHLREFLEESDRAGIRRDEASSLLRSLHTLKAAVMHFHLVELGEVVHKLESDLRSESITSDELFQSCLREGRLHIADALTRVKNEVRDLVGQDYEWRENMHEVEESAIYEFVHVLQAKQTDPELIRQFLSTIAAIPVNECFRAFERSLYDLAEVMGKQLKPVRYTGNNPRVLTQPLQDFLFSLTHVSRNIIDHGIEPPITRMARGKDPAGQTSIHAELIKDERGAEWLHLIISDDGGGIDPSRIRVRLAADDPNGSWTEDDDQAVIQRVFGWGFSTREQANTISGQGVGLEAVQREVQLLGGKIRVESEIYKGTRFEIMLPYRFDLKKPSENGPMVMV